MALPLRSPKKGRPRPKAAPLIAILIAVLGSSVVSGLDVSLPASEQADSGIGQDSTVSCAPPGLNAAFDAGEWLHFSIQYGAIRAGDALMQVQAIEEVGGRPCYHLVSKAESNNFFSLFFKVRDRVDSFLDRDVLVSRRFTKNTREGKYRANVSIDFDQASGLARYSDGAELDLAPCSQDILSAFYYVRTLELEVGQSVHVTCHADKKNYPLEVKVHKRETVRTPAGEFNCLVIEPFLKTSGLFRQKGRLTIWVTDDEYKIPVLMKSKIIVGSISAILTDMNSVTAGGKYAKKPKT